MRKKTSFRSERLPVVYLRSGKQMQGGSISADVLMFAPRNITPQSVKVRPKTSRLAAFERARATCQVTDHMQAYGLKPLKDIELKSIYALFAWVANEQGAAEETVQMMTEARFGVDSVTNLPQKDYDEVIKFLVDLRIDEMQH